MSISNTKKIFRDLLLNFAMALITVVVSASAALADGTVTWTGNGITNGQLNTIQCDANNPPGSMLWILTTGGANGNTVSSPALTVNGDVYSNPNPNGTIYQFATSWYDPAGAITAFANYLGDLGAGAAVLTISHGCPPEDRLWCSPGFWRNHQELSPTSLNALYSSVGGPVTTYSTKKTACAGKSSAPTLQNVLEAPQCYGGPAYNAVATYLSCLAFTNCGDETTGDNCPLGGPAE